MGIEGLLVEVTKNTRGRDSHPVTFKAIGKYNEKIVNRETDEEGKPLGKDAEGNQITREEKVQEFIHEGVLTDVSQALELVGGDEQRFLDLFAEGYNREAYRVEANKDELDVFIAELSLDEDAASQFKRGVNQIMKATGDSRLEAGRFLCERIKAKAQAAA